MHDVLAMHKLHEYHHEPTVGPVAQKGMELAEAYVRVQPLDSIFPPEEGTINGTAFPNLLKPYKGWCKYQPC